MAVQRTEAPAPAVRQPERAARRAMGTHGGEAIPGRMRTTQAEIAGAARPAQSGPMASPTPDFR